MLANLVTVVHIFVCVLLILVVLLQQGKGADMGATFGGGSNTLFGASGADNLLTRVTTVTALVFMCTSVMLASGMRGSSPTANSMLTDLPKGGTPGLAATTPVATTPDTTAEKKVGEPAAVAPAAPVPAAGGTPPENNIATPPPADAKVPAAEPKAIATKAEDAPEAEGLEVEDLEGNEALEGEPTEEDAGEEADIAEPAPKAEAPKPASTPAK